MTDDELLLAISDIMDKKIQPLDTKIDDVESSLYSKIDHMGQLLNAKIDHVEQSLNAKIDSVEQSLNAKIDSVENSLQGQITKINICLENDIKPRLQNIEECYLSTFERYKSRSEQLDQLQLDVSVIKRVLIDHGDKLQKIS